MEFSPGDFQNGVHPPKSRLEPELFSMLFAGVSSETHEAGRTLFVQDDLADRVFGVLTGTVEIAIYSPNGRKLVANIETPGALVGEIGALDGGIRTATATVLTASTLVSVSRRQLIDRLEQNPRLATAMIEMLCARIRWISAELGDQALLKIDARLAKRLVHLSKLMVDESGWIPISQAELAEFLGATRESVNKTLTDWRRNQLIDIKRGGIRVIRPGQLREIAAAEKD